MRVGGQFSPSSSRLLTDSLRSMYSLKLNWLGGDSGAEISIQISALAEILTPNLLAVQRANHYITAQPQTHSPLFLLFLFLLFLLIPLFLRNLPPTPPPLLPLYFFFHPFSALFCSTWFSSLAPSSSSFISSSPTSASSSYPLSFPFLFHLACFLLFLLKASSFLFPIAFDADRPKIKGRQTADNCFLFALDSLSSRH